MSTQITDQILHFVGAMFILCVFAFGGIIGGAVAGLGCGLIRELSEAGGSRITFPEVKAHFTKGFDPWLDLIFWTLGGIVSAIVVVLV